jgi:hypothetical protein
MNPFFDRGIERQALREGSWIELPLWPEPETLEPDRLSRAGLLRTLRRMEKDPAISDHSAYAPDPAF